MRTWLIQRLKKPIGNTPMEQLAKSFAFGGGLLHGGMKKKAMGVIDQIWSFDYMGSSEFEWGAVPDSLSEIWDYCHKRLFKAGRVSLNKEVYYLCHSGHSPYVENLIKQLSKGDGSDVPLKEVSLLKESLNNERDYRVIDGWIELDNHFMFFTDKEMYEKTLYLFGVKNEKDTTC